MWGWGMGGAWGQKTWDCRDGGLGDRHGEGGHGKGGMGAEKSMGTESVGTWGWLWGWVWGWVWGQMWDGGMGRGGWGTTEHGDRRCVWGHGGLGDVGLGHKRAWGQIAWGRGAKAQPGDGLWGTVGTKHGGQAMGPGPQAGGDTNFATTPHPVTSSARPDASLHPPRGGPCPLPYKSGTVTALGAAHAGPGGGIGARKGDGAFGAFTLEPTDGRRCSHVLRAQRGRQVSGGAGRPRHLPRPGAESHLAAAAALSSVSPQRGPRAASCGAAPRTAPGAAAGGRDDGGGRWGRGAERVRRGPRHGGLV